MLWTGVFQRQQRTVIEYPITLSNTDATGRSAFPQGFAILKVFSAGFHKAGQRVEE